MNSLLFVGKYHVCKHWTLCQHKTPIIQYSGDDNKNITDNGGQWLRHHQATSITIQWNCKYKGQYTLPLNSEHQNSFHCILFISLVTLATRQTLINCLLICFFQNNVTALIIIFSSYLWKIYNYNRQHIHGIVFYTEVELHPNNHFIDVLQHDISYWCIWHVSCSLLWHISAFSA